MCPPPHPVYVCSMALSMSILAPCFVLSRPPCPYMSCGPPAEAVHGRAAPRQHAQARSPLGPGTVTLQRAEPSAGGARAGRCCSLMGSASWWVAVLVVGIFLLGYLHNCRLRAGISCRVGEVGEEGLRGTGRGRSLQSPRAEEAGRGWFLFVLFFIIRRSHSIRAQGIPNISTR